MTRIPNNHEHIEAQQVDEYVREVMRCYGIKQAQKVQEIVLLPGGIDIIIRVEIHSLNPSNMPIMVVNIKTEWEGEQ